MKSWDDPKRTGALDDVEILVRFVLEFDEALTRHRNLYNNNLDGTLPSQLGQLTALLWLYVWWFLAFYYFYWVNGVNLKEFAWKQPRWHDCKRIATFDIIELPVRESF